MAGDPVIVLATPILVVGGSLMPASTHLPDRHLMAAGFLALALAIVLVVAGRRH